MATARNNGSVFTEIVLKNFKSMPLWTRVCAFFIALLMLVYLTIHGVVSDYVVTGVVLEPSSDHPGSKQAARGYDVRWGKLYAGTDSKGNYTFALSQMQYFLLFKSGGEWLEVWTYSGNEDLRVCGKATKFNRVEGTFDDYYIDGTCTNEQTDSRPIFNPAPIEAGMFGLPLPTKVTTLTTDADYRLIVTTIKYSERWSRTNSAQMSLVQDGSTLQLENATGTPYGAITILPGQSYAFTDGVHFPSPSLANGRIHLLLTSFLSFFETDETFDLPNMVLGKAVSVSGSMGSQISIIPIGRSTITIYRKDGDADYYARLSQDLLAAGVMPVSAPSPMGGDKPTNTLFIGASAEPSTVKMVVAAILRNGVQLKRITYPYTFVSTNDPARMQLGWSAKCVNSLAIDNSKLTPLDDTDPSQVQHFLSQFSDCSPKR